MTITGSCHWCRATMFRSLALLALAAAPGLVLAEDEHVLVLTSGNFSDVVAKNDKLVVEFYAPWCGHCKKLAPEFETAAGKLKDEGIVLANVDATLDENKALASKYGIQGFPTLKIFRGSEESPSEYQGPREAAGIVTYCKGEFGPASVQLNTTADVTALKSPGDDINVLGVFKEGADAAALKTFVEVADSMRGAAVFSHVVDASIVSDSLPGENSVFIYKSFDDAEAVYDGAMDKEALKKWIEKKSTPRLVSLDKSPVNKKPLSIMFADDKPKVIGILPIESDKIAAFKDALIAANDAHDDLHVLYLDPKENPGALDFFGVKAEDSPLVVVHAPKTNSKYSSGTVDVSKVVSWVADFQAGKVEKVVKSEEIPGSQEGPVTVVVGKSFDSVVRSGKNVFIEFYAPWCGHCKRLEPVWDELAEKFKEVDNLTIAKMDATANDVPDSAFDVKGFPTLYFVQSSGEISKYEGGRTLEDLTKFVEDKAGVSPASKAEDSSDKKDEL
eukprot:jgi/Ulvmu1/4411/UM002_0136.1